MSFKYLNRGLLALTIFIAFSGAGLAEEDLSSRISMDFKNANLKDILKVFSQQAGMNFIASEKVEDRDITLYLDNVTVRDALDSIISANNLVYEQAPGSNVFTVKESIEPEVNTLTEVYTLNYILLDDGTNTTTSNEIVTIVERLLKDKGQVIVNKRTNSLIITAAADKFGIIDDVLSELDTPSLQVMIEAQMIETGLADEEKLGIDWTMRIEASSAARPITFPFQRGSYDGDNNAFWAEGQASSATGTTSTGQTDISTTSLADFSAAQAFPYAAKEAFTFGTLNFTQFKAILEILKQQSDTKIVSNPRIATINDKEANILVGEILSIPIFERHKDTGTFEITGYEERDVGIKLEVTPHINPKGYIMMNIKPEVSSLLGYDTLTNELKVPRLATREAETQVMVKDGETIVIGGLIRESTSDYKKKVPLLGDLPVLGLLFRKTEKVTAKTDLLIFITPRIVTAASMQKQETSTLSQLDVDGELYLSRPYEGRDLEDVPISISRQMDINDQLRQELELYRMLEEEKRRGREIEEY